MNYKMEIFSDNYYFFIKERKNDIALYYSVSNTLNEARKNDEILIFEKKSEKKLKNEIAKIKKDKKIKSTKDLKSHMSKLSFNFRSNSIMVLNFYQCIYFFPLLWTEILFITLNQCKDCLVPHNWHFFWQLILILFLFIFHLIIIFFIIKSVLHSSLTKIVY